MPEGNDRRSGGMTLVELMIVLVVIGIVAAIAIPNLFAGKLAANESATLEHLRSITTAQGVLKSRAVLDNTAPPDGEGEYAFLAELAGAVDLRGTTRPLQPSTLSGQFGLVRQGQVTASGYHFALFLPGPGGAGVAEDPLGGLANAGDVDAELCEQYWVCYAWPQARHKTGNRVFVVNQRGEILASVNDQGYEGLANRPAPDAAFRVAGTITGPLADDGANAADGGAWLPVR